jgi:hypothetical protein
LGVMHESESSVALRLRLARCVQRFSGVDVPPPWLFFYAPFEVERDGRRYGPTVGQLPPAVGLRPPIRPMHRPHGLSLQRFFRCLFFSSMGLRSGRAASLTQARNPCHPDRSIGIHGCRTNSSRRGALRKCSGAAPRAQALAAASWSSYPQNLCITM